MELTKKKYKREEVEQIISDLKREHEERVNELRSEIGVLSEKNVRTQNELALLRDREHLIDSALIDAKRQAEEITNTANLQYLAVIEGLKKFSEKWKAYFKMLSEKYPYYPAVQQAIEIKTALDKALKGKDYKGCVENLDKMVGKALGKSGLIDPKTKINEYITATEGEGFNIDEVLNPGELHLEDLCRELGLMDENE